MLACAITDPYLGYDVIKIPPESELDVIFK